MFPNFVENFEQKEQSLEEGLKRVTECQRILGNTATIQHLAGNLNEPVMMIRIDGFFDADKLLQMHKILKAPYYAIPRY